jgi:hypothetical protein
MKVKRELMGYLSLRFHFCLYHSVDKQDTVCLLREWPPDDEKALFEVL